MLAHYFDSPSTLEQLRTYGAGAHLDGFSDDLKEKGYSRRTARRYLLTAAHLCCFLQHNNDILESLDQEILEQFLQHLPRCHCRKPRGGLGKSVVKGVGVFFEYLQGVSAVRVVHDNVNQTSRPPLVESFRRWLKQHRGAAESTLRLYSYGATQLVRTLGEDPEQYDAQNLREFVLERSRCSGIGATKALIQALRSFLRYLATEGKCSAALEHAIPSVAGWRLATLPHYLTSGDVERTLASCDPNTVKGVRDRAMLLLLVRLALRASDVAGLRLFDFDWEDATVLVSGKTHWEARLPVSQEVGDAVLHYLECRPALDIERVFLRVRPPWRPLSSSGVSSTARWVMGQAGVSAPSLGAHILRHTAATQMLREGLPLDEIRTVLRHRSVDMTATYAKVDIELLRQVAQPWPEVLRCS